jgi:adenine-specific DNA-methyltransferase
LARQLNRDGHYRGDPEFERHGIFEGVTRPRVTAAVTGLRPDGRPVVGAYVDGREYAEGLEENVEFLRLDYLDPMQVELGSRFDETLPTLWLSAGGCGRREGIDPTADFSVATDGPYAFLLRPSGVEGLLAALAGRPDVTHAFVLTNSEDAFSELAEQLPPTLIVRMLPRDYLRSFGNGREAGG